MEGGASSGGSKTCDRCGKMISGQFLRAMNVFFCMDCFRCSDCNQVVAERFFPLVEDGKRSIYCEKDYFTRLDLICHKCGGPLRGPHVAALGRKYHMEHFTCSVCPTVFRQHDAYFEQNGEIFCREHSTSMYAPACGCCSAPVLSNCVQMRKGGVSEQWHPECYMMYKLWNIKIPNPVVTNIPGINERVLQTLSAFEEASADSLYKMLLALFNGNHSSGVSLGKDFLFLISSLFRAGDCVAEAYGGSSSSEDGKDTNASSKDDLHGEGKGAQHYRKEPKQLCKKIIRLFSILSTMPANFQSQRDEATNNEIVATVTSLARSLKSLIKVILAGAFLMDTPSKCCAALLQLLSILEAKDGPGLRLDDFASDACGVCSNPIEAECFEIGGSAKVRIHASCFRCQNCDSLIPISQTQVYFDPEAHRLFDSQNCASSAKAASLSTVKPVSRLQQYSFLLFCGLKRLESSFLKQQNGSSSVLGSGPGITNPPAVPMVKQSSTSSATQPVVQEAVDWSTKYVTDDLPLPMKKSIVAELGRLLPGRRDLLNALQLNELPKQSVWDKLISVINPSKTSNTRVAPVIAGGPSGVFGVSLDSLMSQGSVVRSLKFESLTVELPIAFDIIVETLRSSDLTVEGVFRRNGNIKRLKEIAEAFDSKNNGDMASFEKALKDEPPIQLAALLKKFFRELPEPILPFAFHPILMAIQELPDPASKSRALHLIICLLPKPNINVLLALIFFLKHVAANATTSTGDTGNRMDLHSLATVLAPNLLYSPGAAVTSQQEAQNSIGVVYGLLDDCDRIVRMPKI